MKFQQKNRFNVLKTLLLSITVPVFVTPLLSMAASARGLGAQPPGDSNSAEKVTIAGHIDLQGMQVKNMFLQRRGDKSYLFLRRADKNSFAVVDVTNPTKPVVVDRQILQQPSGGTVDLPPSGSALAIAFVPDAGTAAAASGAPTAVASLPTESVRLIDLTDPQHPKTIRTFTGVTSVATDEGRKLVFIANNEGLWIVAHHRSQPLPMCTSESEIAAVADCQ